MFSMGALFALVMALLFPAVFTLGFRRGPWSSVPVFFLLVFLAVWRDRAIPVECLKGFMGRN